MITAKFGNKTFEVSRNKVNTPDEISYSESLNLEEVERAGQKPSVNIKGINLKDLSFNISLDSRFVNIENEISEWDRIMMSKKSYVFYLGRSAIGRFFLTQVDKDSINLSKIGTYTKAKLTLTFKEDGNNSYVEQPKPPKVQQVVNSSSSSVSKSISVGTRVKPKNGTRWYETAQGAINRTGKSGKAYNRNMSVSYVYQNGKAINPEGLGWMIPKDVDVV